MKTTNERVYQGFKCTSKENDEISALYNGYPFFILNAGGIGVGLQVFVGDINAIVDVLRRVQKEQAKLEQLNLEDFIDKEFGGSND